MNGKRMWRTLVRVETVNQDRRWFYAIIPAWSLGTKVRIEMDSLPQEIQALIEPGRRLHAYANTGAESVHDLSFDIWESA